MGVEVLTRYRMEWPWPAVVAFTWALLTAPFVIKWFFFRVEKLKNGTYDLPPGPPTWPLIGNINVLLNTKKPIYHIIDDLSKVYGPIMFLKVGIQNLVFVSNPEVTAEFLKTQDHVFGNRPTGVLAGRYLLYGEDHLTLSNLGEHHSFVRKLFVTELLSNTKIKGYQTRRVVEQTLITREMLEASSRKESVEVRDLLHALSINVVTQMAFSKRFFGSGVPIDKSSQQWILVVTNVTSRYGQILAEAIHPSLKWIDTLTGARKEMQKCFRRADVLLQELLDERMRHLDSLTSKELEEYEAKDFMEVMLLKRKRQQERRFTNRIIKAVLLDLIVAATDTSVATIEWALTELLVNPDVMKRMQEEVDSLVGFDRNVQESDLPRMPYLAAVFKETLRLHPPLPWLVPHSSRVDCKVGGYDIPAESIISFNVYGISRNESLWENPLKFNPDRFLSNTSDVATNMKGGNLRFLPFGAGRRSCPGTGMASVLVHSTLARLVQSFDWSLPNGQGELDMTMTSGAVATKKIPLRACLTPRLRPELYA